MACTRLDIKNAVFSASPGFEDVTELTLSNKVGLIIRTRVFIRGMPRVRCKQQPAASDQCHR
jgi:hypothetical protein